jgi:hypothetical protein
VLFGDQIQEGSLRPWLKVTVTLLLLIGAAIVGFDAWDSYQRAGGGSAQTTAEQNAAAARARNAQIGRDSAEAMRQVQELRRAKAATKPAPSTVPSR